TRRRSCWPTWMPTASTRSRYTSLHELVAAPRFHLLLAGPDSTWPDRSVEALRERRPQVAVFLAISRDHLVPIDGGKVRVRADGLATGGESLDRTRGEGPQHHLRTR